MTSFSFHYKDTLSREEKDEQGKLGCNFCTFLPLPNCLFGNLPLHLNALILIRQGITPVRKIRHNSIFNPIRNVLICYFSFAKEFSGSDDRGVSDDGDVVALMMGMWWLR